MRNIHDEYLLNVYSKTLNIYKNNFIDSLIIIMIYNNIQINNKNNE
jgi:hypothetical protein